MIKFGMSIAALAMCLISADEPAQRMTGGARKPKTVTRPAHALNITRKPVVTRIPTVDSDTPVLLQTGTVIAAPADRIVSPARDFAYKVTHRVSTSGRGSDIYRHTISILDAPGNEPVVIFSEDLVVDGSIDHSITGTGSFTVPAYGKYVLIATLSHVDSARPVSMVRRLFAVVPPGAKPELPVEEKTREIDPFSGAAATPGRPMTTASDTWVCAVGSASTSFVGPDEVSGDITFTLRGTATVMCNGRVGGSPCSYAIANRITRSTAPSGVVGSNCIMETAPCNSNTTYSLSGNLNLSPGTYYVVNTVLQSCDNPVVLATSEGMLYVTTYQLGVARPVQ